MTHISFSRTQEILTLLRKIPLNRTAYPLEKASPNRVSKPNWPRILPNLPLRKEHLVCFLTNLLKLLHKNESSDKKLFTNRAKYGTITSSGTTLRISPPLHYEEYECISKKYIGHIVSLRRKTVFRNDRHQ